LDTMDLPDGRALMMMMNLKTQPVGLSDKAKCDLQPILASLKSS